MTQAKSTIAEEQDGLPEEPRPGREPPLPGWTHPELDFPTFRLTLLAKAIDRLTVRTFNESCDLTLAEWRVLGRLAPLDGATVGQLAEMAWVDRAETSRAASSLKARGFVDQRAAPADRRAPILFLTEAGRAEYARLLPVRVDFHRRLVEALSPAERDQLDGLLGKIAGRVEQLPDE